MEQIQLIDFVRITPHPDQNKIYGEYEIDIEFETSIENEGIITPIIITPAKVFNIPEPDYVIISGHRRYKAAIKQRITEIPCIIREYKTADEATLYFMLCNLQRIKSDSILRNEYFTIKHNLLKLGKIRKGKGLYSETIFNDADMNRSTKLKNIEPGVPLNGRQIIWEIYGISIRKQQGIMFLFDDDKMANIFNEIKNDYILDKANNDELNEFWLNSRRGVDEGGISIFKSVESVKKKIKEIKKRLKPIKKPKLTKIAPEDIKKPKIIDKKDFKDGCAAFYSFIQNTDALKNFNTHKINLEDFVIEFYDYIHV